MTGFWDEFRIEQILVNLLTNALRYGEKKPIEICCEIGSGLHHNSVQIDVTDHGKGISEADLRRIFEPFERAVDKDAPAGMGLGLYIARQLAESHGGSIGLQSRLGAGTTFSLVLPLSTEHLDQPPSTAKVDCQT